MWREVALQVGGGEQLETPAGLPFEKTAAAIAAVGGRSAYVGYSQGGRLALQIALDHPASVTHLVVISAGAGLSGEEAAARRRDDEALATYVEQHGVAEFLTRWLQQDIFSGRDATAAGAHRIASSVEVASQLRLLGQGAMPDLWLRLGEIEMPALIVAGELDDKYVETSSRLVAEIGENARLRVVPGAGHAVVETHPAEVAALLREFLDL